MGGGEISRGRTALTPSVVEGFPCIEAVETLSFWGVRRWGDEVGWESEGLPEREELGGGLEGVHEVEGAAGFGSEATGWDSEDTDWSPAGLPEKPEKLGGKETPSKIKNLPVH